VEDKELDEGVKLHFNGGGHFECSNCDWATNELVKAQRHKKLYNHMIWMSLLGSHKKEARDE
jgi:hypothetical protein